MFNANRIWLDSTGTVTGKVDGKPGYYLGIRPESSAAARPGDDILLTLGIRSEGDIKAFNFTYKKPDGTNESKPAEVTLSEADYLAVYDKKMLWRANLYIDEGNLDWNNVHPWNAPPAATTALANYPSWGKNADGTSWVWGYNDWNVDEAGNVITGATAGKQVVSIKSWTRFDGGTANLFHGGAVQNHVAYGWGCWDSVAGFNNEMDEQRLLIKDARVNNEDGGTVYIDGYSDLQWLDNLTTAPSSNWENYIFPARRLANEKYYYSQNFTAAQIEATPQHLYYLNGSQRSVPGLSTVMRWAWSGLDYYEFNQTGRTSGIDCSGLAHRATKYNGSTVWVATHDGNPDDKFGTRTFAGETNAGTDIKPNWVQEANPTATLQMRAGEWFLHLPDTSSQADLQRRENDRLIISRAVPGDLLVVGGSHVMIIQNLRYPEGSNVIRVIIKSCGRA